MDNRLLGVLAQADCQHADQLKQAMATEAAAHPLGTPTMVQGGMTGGVCRDWRQGNAVATWGLAAL